MITNKRILVNKTTPSIRFGLCADEIIDGFAISVVVITEAKNGYNLICQSMGRKDIVKMIFISRKEEFEWQTID